MAILINSGGEASHTPEGLTMLTFGSGPDSVTLACTLHGLSLLAHISMKALIERHAQNGEIQQGAVVRLQRRTAAAPRKRGAHQP